MTDRVSREMTFEEEACLYEKEARAIFEQEKEGGEPRYDTNVLRRGMRIIRKARELNDKKHGTWAHPFNDKSGVRCSRCGAVYSSLGDTAYCPNCGARMEDKSNEN